MSKKPRVIAVVGPTATGKSALAVRLAKRINGEIISADSRQVYRELDIGTGKITKREMRGVPHHLLDVESPRRAFSAARFKHLAEQSVRYIEQNGRVPIVVGGTGFYLDALLGTVSIPEVLPDPKLRRRLEQRTTPQLAAQLRRLDPRRAAGIDVRSKMNNRRRLIRAIEIAKSLGSVPPSDCFDIPKQYNVLWIGITHPPKVLRERIQKRLHARLRRGMVAEARHLHANGLSYKRMRELGLEYRYLADHLQGKLSKEELRETLGNKIWQYAKRQQTWFKRNKKIRWFRPSESRKIEALAAKFLAS